MSELEKRLASLSPEKRALLMQQLARNAQNVKPQQIGRRERPARLPLSSAQQRLWILDQLDPGNTVYNITSVLRFVGTLDLDALGRALSEIVRRHESLRTVFGSDDQGPFQRILPASPLPLPLHDFGHLPEAERYPAGLALARQDAQGKFDLVNGPVLRGCIARIGEQEHLLILSAHHIAVDGWSFGVLAEELSRLYTAYLSGEASPLPELAIQYADYSLWQQEEFEGEGLRKQLAYWQEQFKNPPSVLELPGDRPRPAVQSYRGAMHRALIRAEVVEQAKRFARQEGATLFMVFLAAYDALLARYSGQEDIVVGIGNANRPRRELEPLIGFFVNTMPLRCDLSGDPSFRDLLAQIKRLTIDSYANQDVPVERLLETLNIGRDLSHTPLFQTMLFFQNFPERETQLPGVTLRPVDMESVHSATARADISVFAHEGPSGLHLLIEYASDLFGPEYVAGFAQHLERLLTSAIAAPEKRLSELDILTAAERQTLLREWNATAAELPAERSLHALFRAQAARSPQAVAVLQDGVAMSYAELDAQSDAVAARLRAQGCGRGAMVGLYLERSARMIVALLGTLKAGAAYVPLDPSYPVERIVWMLEDSAAPVVLSERGLLNAVPAGTHATLAIEDILQAAPAGDAPADESTGEDTAYVIFTSGSTGRPKGVRVPHGAAVNFLASMAREPGLRADDTLCAITTLSFDIALLELMLPLTVGARIALADRATAGDGEALATLLERVQATVMQATPATWRMLLDAGWTGRAGMRLFCGGEALPRDLADRLLGCGSALWNLYGPTETTVWSTVEQVRPGEGAVSIGRPIANTEVYIVDGKQRLLPIGIPGELLIGGLGVTQGYLDRPELTAEKFIADPFGPRPQGRLYRTGDLARWRRDGRLEVIGRIDHQVKLRGFRIELGEIESVLAASAQVAQAVVICREDRPGDKRLVAYLIPADAAAGIDTAALRNTARERLPDYMLPSAVVVLEKYPLTPNGKVDRRALPAPDAGADSGGDAYVAPRTPEEEILATLWAEVLGRPQVGVHDDFFAMGGHSLLATQLVTRMQKALGDDINLRMLFEHPTVAGLADALLRQRMAEVDEAALAGMLNELEGLSDADLEALLSAR